MLPNRQSGRIPLFKISKLVNKENNGYMQIITPIETNIFDETDKKLNKWRNKMPPKSEIEQFYTQLNNIVEKKPTNKYSINERLFFLNFGISKRKLSNKNSGESIA